MTWLTFSFTHTLIITKKNVGMKPLTNPRRERKHLKWLLLSSSYWSQRSERRLALTFSLPPLSSSLIFSRASTVLFKSLCRRRPKSLNMVEPPDRTMFCRPRNKVEVRSSSQLWAPVQPYWGSAGVRQETPCDGCSAGSVSLNVGFSLTVIPSTISAVLSCVLSLMLFSGRSSQTTALHGEGSPYKEDAWRRWGSSEWLRRPLQRWAGWSQGWQTGKTTR